MNPTSSSNQMTVSLQFVPFHRLNQNLSGGTDSTADLLCDGSTTLASHPASPTLGLLLDKDTMRVGQLHTKIHRPLYFVRSYIFKKMLVF
ncbi:hypothetical protein GIB67_033602 [Kingdonia uniflora]|uniref:Uncharacterized protein n=1 Tax=Kingdonia uniflora TaxID=39325 RepID=A0A7J7LAL5_9MAGN|nr:hypothetical protein GIB67_033602 [Kingdonia uniflora]